MGNHMARSLQNKEVTHERGFDLGRVTDCEVDTETGALLALIVDPRQANRTQIRDLHGLELRNRNELVVPARLVADDAVSERIVVHQ